MSEADVNRQDVEMAAARQSPSHLASTKRKVSDGAKCNDDDDDGYEAGVDERGTAGSDGFKTPPRRSSPEPAKEEEQQQPAAKKAKKVAAPQDEVQFKAGKLVFKQKSNKFTNTTAHMTGLLNFNNNYLQDAEEPLSEIGADSLPLIARYVHESELTVAALAKDIRKKILLSDDDDSQSQASQVIDKLPLALLEKTINEIAERVNYGLSPNDVASSSTAPSTASIPAALQLWRWEVRDLGLLPSERQEDIVQRREERKAARAKALALFNALPDDEREQLLNGKKGKASKVNAADSSTPSSANVPGKSDSKPAPSAAAAFASSPKPLPSTSAPGKSQALPANEANASEHNATEAGNKDTSPTQTADSGVVVIEDSDDEEQQGQGRRGSVASGSKSASASPTKKAAGKRKTSGSKKKDDNLTPEQLAEKKRKEEEKEKKRLQKEAKEAKQRKEQELTKQTANKFSAFFGKASPAVRDSRSPATPAVAAKAEGDGLNDFQRTFAPGVYKCIAPINRFAEGKTANISALDQALSSSATDAAPLSRPKALSELVPLLNTQRCKRERATIRPPLSVRDAISLRDNAAIANDADLEQRARRALESLREDRKLVPVKLLQFATDLRPAWFGTWTRPSNMISGRQPLRQDTVGLDYNYDSEAEWGEGEDGQGEEVDADDGEDAMSVSEDGSEEMDDWLVDDLEDDVEAEGGAGSGNDDDEDDDMSEILETDPFGNPVSPIAQRNVASSSKAAPGPRRIPLPGRGGPLKLGGKSGKDRAALKAKTKKKKVVPNSRRITTKLVPMTIGPCWEQTLSEPAHTAFSGYQMEFLNDAYAGLDPFSFVSEDPAKLGKDAAAGSGGVVADESAASTSATTFTSSAAAGKAKGTLDALFAGSSTTLPVDGNAPSSSASTIPTLATATAGGSSSSTATPSSSLPTASASSLPLPEDVVLSVIRSVEGMEDTKPVVVARLYSDLRQTYKGITITKKAITETVDAVAQREGRKQDSPWRVRPEWRGRLASGGGGGGGGG